ncbi:10880_t:CDS:1 [Paraglomus occultum]|uniref:10880_t:CDS:1 n=1 Tax=Paraglomus occultum TaxID=144539 RepID=A0A9N9CEE7_9GLOM|nr:10880_t:CDS:1 [Paraglomus occultum]
MATVALGLPILSGEPEEDIEQFINLFAGHLDSLGINPADVAGGPPSGSKRAVGILRACMKESAAIWFDEHITGKRWRLRNLFNNHGQNNWADVLNMTMQELVASNSFRNPSRAYSYATNPANNAVTLANSGLIPAHGLYQDWRDIGGEPTDEPATDFAVGHNNPIVLPEIGPGEAIQLIRTEFPTVLQEQREVRFGNLAQENDPVDVFYRKVQRSGRLLNFSDDVIENQFFRGLSPENMLEADRIGPNKPFNELVDALKRVEKRKAEMRLGLSNRNTRKAIIQEKHSSDSPTHTITPVQIPPVSQQEPIILKPATSGITQEQIDQILKAHTEKIMQNFQNQLQAFQKEIVHQAPIQQPTPVESRESCRERISEVLQQMREDREKNYLSNISFQEAGRELRQLDLKPIDVAVARRFAKRREKSKDRQLDKYIDNVLSGDLGKLNINDEEPTKTSNLLYESGTQDIVSSNDILDFDDEYTICAVRKKKSKI